MDRCFPAGGCDITKIQFFRGQVMRLRMLRERLVCRDAIFSFGKFQVIPLTYANERHGEGKRNGRQLFPIESRQAETIETQGKSQRQDQSSLRLKSRISIEKKPGADKLKTGTKEQKKTAQTQFKPDCQVGIVRAAFATHKIQIRQFLPK